MLAAPLPTLSITEPEIMVLAGRLDGDTSIPIEEDILLCIQSGAREMVLDCSRLTTITGAGMQTLLRLAREMQAVRGKLVVCKLQPQVREMFDVCGIENMIAIYPDQATAKEALAA